MSANPATLWSAEEIAELRRLHAQVPALSFTDIAAQLPGRDRNACIGKAHRLKLPDRSEMRSHGRPRAVRGPVIRRRGPVSPTRILDAKRKQVAAARPEPSPVRMVLLDASDGCRWPCGDYPFVSCGHPVEKGLPYCLEHARLAYRPRKAA